MHESVDTVTRQIGERLRTHRLARQLSIGELAAAAGLSKSALARIEASGGNPSIETLWRVASTLGLPLGALLEPPGPRARVIRRADVEPTTSADGMRGFLVHTEGRDHRAELFEIELPDAVHRSEPHIPGTEEVVLCLEGTVRVGPVGDEAELGPGDAVLFDATGAHSYAGPGRVLNWMLYPA